MQLVSCIMPTRGRQKLAEASLQCFLNQDYVQKELIILDDADDPSFPSGIPAHVEIEYRLTSQRLNIPQKRNLLCKWAGGEVIAHWDDDDWYHPGRLSHQMKLLAESGKSVVGYRSGLFHGPDRDQVSLYVRQGDYAIGASFVYRKAYWEKHPFPEHMKVGEDGHFVYRAADAGELLAVHGEHYMVCRIHPGNTAAKNTNNDPYRRATPADLPEGYPVGL